MQGELTESKIIVTREPSDKPYPLSAAGESRLMYHVKLALIGQGHDVIKKLMWKDGHLVSDTEHYIRERSGKWGAWYPAYAIRYATEDFNAGRLEYDRVNWA